MESGYEALPPRATGRQAKRRRPDDSASASSGNGDAAQLASPSFADADRSALAAPYAPCYANEKFEYLDHTADVQIHSWGDSLGEAFIYCAVGMFNYKTDLQGIAIDPDCTKVVAAEGHDLISLLFNFLDACLTTFTLDDFIAKDFKLISISAPGLVEGSDSSAFSSLSSAAVDGRSDGSSSNNIGSGAKAFSIRVVAYGERFVFGKHQQGTEVKAITYSNMQIFTPSGRVYTAGEGTGITAVAAGAATVERIDNSELASPGEESVCSPAALPQPTSASSSSANGAGTVSMNIDATEGHLSVAQAAAAAIAADAAGVGASASAGASSSAGNEEEEGGVGAVDALDPLRPTGRRRAGFDVYVIVDI